MLTSLGFVVDVPPRGLNVGHQAAPCYAIAIIRRLPVLLLCVCLHVAPVSAGGSALSWLEIFADDPIDAGRFSVPAGHDPSRFDYEATHQRLVIHYDTFLPTAWYVRPLDSAGQRTLGRCDDFEFSVKFTVRSTGFFADPFQFAQIGWGLINSQTTGVDRAGGEGPGFAFDVVGFDYFPNVSPQFGGPTMGPTVVHSDSGQGYFAEIEFAFGAETTIDDMLGEEAISLDVPHEASVRYDAASGSAILTITRNKTPLVINADGSGGPGGPDGDITTIQTILFNDGPFEVDSFAITAWQDTFNPFDSSVIADVEIVRVAFSAPAALQGDLNHDGQVDGLDIAPFIAELLDGPTTPCVLTRADFSNDTELTLDDLDGFIAALLAS